MSDNGAEPQVLSEVDRVVGVAMRQLYTLDRDESAVARLGRGDGSSALDLILGGLPYDAQEIDAVVCETVLPLWAYHRRGNRTANTGAKWSLFSSIDRDLNVRGARAARLKNSLAVADTPEEFNRALSTVVRMARAQGAQLNYEQIARAVYHMQTREGKTAAMRVLAGVGQASQAIQKSQNNPNTEGSQR